ncbi:nucleotidyltransferase domain-containing protein [Alkalihalobacillus sp. CinArs1]|uniref:nucleotidyltransferase domain-containing protein n=1 Tax=Alkalihalobacillus sp. CinArs1 TaxID=2995314 RepID=UPI0022DE11E5|nr:nucleotidyltransferase domain-containing protein [Alkalihalobacillus sp. CinArs1]
MLNSEITPIRFATYAKRLVNRLKTPALRGVILTGSFARGEAGPKSDLDVWCFYHKEVMKPLYLPQLPGVPVHLRSMTIEEYELTMSGEKDVVAPYFEQLVLYGDTPFQLPKKESIQSGKINLLHSIESRLNTSATNEEMYDLLNGVMYLMRIERYLSMLEYPLTISDLYSTEQDKTNRKLIECFSTCLLGDEIQDSAHILSLLKEFVMKRSE